MFQVISSGAGRNSAVAILLLGLGGVPAALSQPLAQADTANRTEQDPHAHHRAMMAAPPAKTPESTTVRLSDNELIDQTGTKRHFASDVIGDRIVVIDFVYTSCTTVCPVLSAVFAQVQSRLGERLGREVALVSVSVDPARDTPARLAAYASRHRAREGWVWLTGDKPVVDRVLQDLGAYTTNFEDHPSMVLVGDGQTGTWTRYFGFPGTDQIMTRVNELAAARQTAAVKE